VKKGLNLKDEISGHVPGAAQKSKRNENLYNGPESERKHGIVECSDQQFYSNNLFLLRRRLLVNNMLLIPFQMPIPESPDQIHKQRNNKSPDGDICPPMES